MDDEEHNLQRAVKRLIHQAQLETDSPTPAASFVSPSSDPAAFTQSPIDGKPGDPTPDRPVFGAYPMPQSLVNQAQNDSGNAQTSSIGAAFPGQFALNQGGFNFSVDQNNLSTFPSLEQGSFQPQSQPNLDPAVESMLASYFPPATTGNTGEIGPAATSQVPDDFLSKVFSFSWDNTNQNQNAGQSQTPTQGTPQNQNTQAMRSNGAVPPQPPQRQDSIPGYGAFDWSSHGWMA